MNLIGKEIKTRQEILIVKEYNKEYDEYVCDAYTLEGVFDRADVDKDGEYIRAGKITN